MTAAVQVASQTIEANREAEYPGGCNDAARDRSVCLASTVESLNTRQSELRVCEWRRYMNTRQRRRLPRSAYNSLNGPGPSKVRSFVMGRLERLETRDLLTGFVAYNAVYSGANADPNLTNYADVADRNAAGPLRDIETGDLLTAAVSVSSVGVTFGGQGTSPHPDSDAGHVFGDYVDFTGADRRTIEINADDVYSYTFENLDPGALFDFAGTAVRGNPSYTDRWTLVEIEGADSFTHAHSDGIGILRDGLDDNQVAFWGGHNTLADQGFIVQWLDVDPGDDGEFSISARQYTGPIPAAVDAGQVASGNKGYGLSAFRLVEQTPIGPPVIEDLAPTSVSATSAQLQGRVVTTGGQLPQITLHYGTSDGGTDAEAWEHAVSVPPGRNYTQILDGLLSNTTYYYRSFAENDFGSDWADASSTLTTLTLSAPSMTTLPPASIGGSLATLEGRVDATGNDVPLVTLYYGTSDGGTNVDDWAQATNLGEQTGSFVTTIDGLEPETDYYYAFWAQNALGGDWGGTQQFKTGDIPGLVISEILADNGNRLTTRVRSDTSSNFVGDFLTPDWIEIQNATGQPASLTGYSLTDDLTALDKWQFPSGTVVPANGHLVVFASGYNILDVNQDQRGSLHTSFQLSTLAGSNLALVAPDQQIVSLYEKLPGQFEDISYGLAPNGQKRYFAVPSPGELNNTQSPQAPTISLPSQTFTDSLTVEIVPAEATHTIHYTTDESLPTATSPVYTGPIEISTRSTNLRAIAIAANGESSVVVGESYIRFVPQIGSEESHLPILIVDTFGDSISRDRFGDDFVAIIEPGEDGISRPTDPYTLATRAGLKIRGSSSAGFSKKQYRVEFRDELGEDRKLPVLGMPKEADWIFYGPSQFDRNLISNPLMYDLSNQIGRYAVRTQWVEAYFNGRYYGVYAIMEVIEQGDDRVDVEPLSSGAGGQPVEGGFIWKNDRGSAYVDPEQLTTAQRRYIDGYIDDFANAAASSRFKDPDRGYAAYIDVGSFIDHNILNLLPMNVDALRLSSFYYKSADGKLEAGPIWDFDRSLDSTDGRDNNPRTWYGTGDSTRYFNDSDRVRSWWPDMFQDPDFVQRYIDRWFELRQTTLSDENLVATIDQHAATIGAAGDRDYARWSSSRYGNFAGEINHLKSWLQARVDWIDSRWQAAPESDASGNRVLPGSSVVISPGAGTVYYTLDGSDPRGDDGAIQPNAQIASGPITINADAQLFARTYRSGFGANNGYVRSGDDWSAPLKIASYQEPASAESLAITEIHFNPRPADVLAGEDNEDNDEFEFLELRNVGEEAIDLEGVQLVEVDVDGDQQGIQYTFAPQILAPGESIVVVENVDAFQSRYGESPRIAAGQADQDDPAGQYNGRLANGGERLTLLTQTGAMIRQFDYDDWYASTDGDGYSLVLLHPNETSGDVLSEQLSWRPSAEIDGSPGASEPMRGDVDDSGSIDAADIDLLYAAIASSSDEPQFDVNEDGSTDEQDVDFLVEQLLETRRGDANLDGTVSFADFLLLASNFGKSDIGWAGGDFDGSRSVDFADFLALASSFGFDREVA